MFFLGNVQKSKFSPVVFGFTFALKSCPGDMHLGPCGLHPEPELSDLEDEDFASRLKDARGDGWMAGSVGAFRCQFF